MSQIINKRLIGIKIITIMRKYNQIWKIYIKKILKIINNYEKSRTINIMSKYEYYAPSQELGL